MSGSGILYLTSLSALILHATPVRPAITTAQIAVFDFQFFG